MLKKLPNVREANLPTGAHRVTVSPLHICYLQSSSQTFAFALTSMALLAFVIFEPSRAESVRSLVVAINPS